MSEDLEPIITWLSVRLGAGDVRFLIDGDVRESMPSGWVELVSTR